MHAYKPEVKKSVLMTHVNKEEGLSYISEAMFVGQSVPGPAKYTVNDELTRSRSPIVRMIKPNKIIPVKIKKSDLPDQGTYQRCDT